MSKHTPGPWEIKTGAGGHSPTWLRVGTAAPQLPVEWQNVAFVVNGNNQAEIEIRDANARLIAAAPKLLKTLKTIQHKLDNYDGESLGTLSALAGEAIAEAAMGGEG